MRRGEVERAYLHRLNDREEGEEEGGGGEGVCVYVQGTKEQSEPMILYVGSEDEANNNEVGGGQKWRGRNGRIKGKKNHK